MDKNFFHNHLLYKYRKRIALLLLIGFLGSPLGGALPVRAADETKETSAMAPSGGFMQDVILGPMKTFFSGLASFNYGDFLKLIIKDSLNTVVDRFYSQVVKSFEDEYLVQDYNRQVFVPYLDFGFAKFHNWVASEVGDAKIDAPLLNAFLGLENLAYRGLKETGNKLSHSILKELDKVSKEMSGEDRPPSISDHDYWGKSMARIWTTPQGLLWGAVGTTMDVAASSEAEGNRDYIISEGHNDGRKVTDMPEAIESYFLKRGENLNKSELLNKLNGRGGWGYTEVPSTQSGVVSGYSLASKGTYSVYPLSNGFYRFDIWSWDANFPFALFCDIQYKIDVIKTLVKPNVWQEPQEVYPASIAFTSRAISNPLASGWTGLIKRPGQKVKVMVNDLIESKLKIAGDASDLSGVSRIMYDLGKTYLTNVNFKVKRATSGALNGCPIGFEVIEPDLGTTMRGMSEPQTPSAGQCLIAALKQVDTNFLGEMVGWLSDLGKKIICWIFDRQELKEKGDVGIGTQKYIMVPNQGPLPSDLNLTGVDLEALNKSREEAAKTDPNGSTPLLIKGEPQVSGEYKRKDSPLSYLTQFIFYEEIIKPLMPDKIKSIADAGFDIIIDAIASAVPLLGDVIKEAKKGFVGEAISAFLITRTIRWLLSSLGFCNVKPPVGPIINKVDLLSGGHYDFLEFPYSLAEKSNVIVEIYLTPTGASEQNKKLYRKLVFNDMPAGVHIARWDLSTDLSDSEWRQIWNDETKSVFIEVVFKKEVNGAFEQFGDEYTISDVEEAKFQSPLMGYYDPDPTTAVKNCHKQSYFPTATYPNPNPCGKGYLTQNYMLELEPWELSQQNPPPANNTNVFDRQFVPAPTFYEGQKVQITMRYNTTGPSYNYDPKTVDNVHVTLYDLAGVEGSPENFFEQGINFYTGDLVSAAKSQLDSKKAKIVYEKTIDMASKCPSSGRFWTEEQPGCVFDTVNYWSLVGSGAHAFMMVFDDKDSTQKDKNKLNNRIIQIVNVSKSPVILEDVQIIDGPKTADLRGDGDHPDGDGTGVANPGEDIEIGVTLKAVGLVDETDLELYIDLDNSTVLQYIGAGKVNGATQLGDNKTSILVKSVLSGDIIRPQDFNLHVRDNTTLNGVTHVPLYIRDQYGRVIFFQDLEVKVAPRCDDKVDNDKDGFIDGDDCNCKISADNSEDGSTDTCEKPDLIPVGMTYTPVPQCSDGKDNDNDGTIDFEGYKNSSGTVFPMDQDCNSKKDMYESGAEGIAKDADLSLEFQVQNQGLRGIWASANKTMPTSIYVCYGKPATKANYQKGWRFNTGYYCEPNGNSKYITERKEVQLPVDECYCEPKPPASGSVLSSVPEYFALPDSGFPTADEITDSYREYMNCIEKKYKLVDSFNYPITEDWGIGETRTISKPFKVLEDRDMRFAIIVNGQVDSSSNETISESVETNNKAGFPDYFCKESEGTAYLTLDPAINRDQCYYFDSDKVPPKYLSPICMDNFSKAGDYRIRIGETHLPLDVGVKLAPSPFRYQYVCPSGDKCNSKYASCVGTPLDYKANPGESMLLTINLTNTAQKDVKSTFTLIDGPGTRTGINLTTPELDSEAGKTKQLFFYVTIPMIDKDQHPYQNGDILNFTLKGHETEKGPKTEASPNKPGTDFIVAAAIPVKLGAILFKDNGDSCIQGLPQPPEQPPFTNIAIKYLEWMKQGTSYASVNSYGSRILHSTFQILNTGTTDVNDLSYEYYVHYFKEKPPDNQIDVQGCYNGDTAVDHWSAPSFSLAKKGSSVPITIEDSYEINLDMNKWGYFQVYVYVSKYLNIPLHDDNDNDHRKCSGLVEVKKPDLVVASVQAKMDKGYLGGSVKLVNAGSEELDLGNTVKEAEAIVSLFDEYDMPKGTFYVLDFKDTIGGKLGPGASKTINIKGHYLGTTTIPDYYKKGKISVNLTETDEKYDLDKGNNSGESLLIELSETLGASTQRFLTLGQRIKRVLNYVRAKLGD